MIKGIEIAHSDFLNDLAPDAFVDELGTKLAEQMSSGQAAGQYSHYVCSSTLDIHCSSGWFDPLALSRRMQKLTGVPCTYSNAMQCATWGFMVRQHLVHKPGVRDLVLSIVDANPLRMRFWQDNSSWGRTSQRVTMVHLELPVPAPGPDGSGDELADTIVTGKCNPEAMLYDYARAIQKAAVSRGGHTLSIPYFSEKMRKGLKRSMNGHDHLPDLYERYGHLCGADPWMSIARDHQRGTTEGKRYLASSIASEGYYCFLSASVDGGSRMHVEE